MAKKKYTVEEFIAEFKDKDGYDEYIDMLQREKHHDHMIVEDDNGTLRWEQDNGVWHMINEKLNLNDLVIFFHYLGWDKNSEEYRHMYRSMGYSLSGYWEIFYWEANNEDAEYYEPKKLEKVKA